MHLFLDVMDNLRVHLSHNLFKGGKLMLLTEFCAKNYILNSVATIAASVMAGDMPYVFSCSVPATYFPLQVTSKGKCL